MSEINNVSVKAVKGDEGTVEGIDYSGANVLSYIKQLPALNWSLVTKIDKEELFKVIEEQAQEGVDLCVGDVDLEDPLRVRFFFGDNFICSMEKPAGKIL